MSDPDAETPDVLSPRANRLMALLWVILFGGRWIVITGVTWAGLLSADQVAEWDRHILLYGYLLLLTITVIVVALRALRSQQSKPPRAPSEPGESGRKPGLTPIGSEPQAPKGS